MRCLLAIFAVVGLISVAAAIIKYLMVIIGLILAGLCLMALLSAVSD